MSGDRLLSGSGDGTVRIWAPAPAAAAGGGGGAAAGGRCERVLAGHAGGVFSLAALAGGRAASGGADGAVRVWAVATGEALLTMAGHDGAVWALAAAPAGAAAWGGGGGWAAAADALASAGEDGTVRVWSAATGACARSARAFAAGSGRFVGCLAVCGGRLVGGARGRGAWSAAADGGAEVRVWELDTLAEVAALARPGGGGGGGGVGGGVNALLADGAEVWAAEGDRVVVWGRCDLPAPPCPAAGEGEGGPASAAAAS